MAKNYLKIKKTGGVLHIFIFSEHKNSFLKFSFKFFDIECIKIKS